MENGGFGASGQNVVEVVDLKNDTSSVVAYTGADLNSSNVILTVPLAAVGLTADTPFTFSVRAFDNYFLFIPRATDDAINNVAYTPSRPMVRLRAPARRPAPRRWRVERHRRRWRRPGLSLADRLPAALQALDPQGESQIVTVQD